MEDPINYFKYWRPSILYVGAYLVKTREFDVEGGRFTVYYPIGEQRYLSPIRLVLGKNVSPRLRDCRGGLKYLLLDAMVRMRMVRYAKNNPHVLLEIRAIRPDGFRAKMIKYMIGVFSDNGDTTYFPEKHILWRGYFEGLIYSVIATPFGEETWRRKIGRCETINLPVWADVYRKNHKLFNL